MIVLKLWATPPGTVGCLLGTEMSAGHIHTDWGFVVGLSTSEQNKNSQWACVYLHFSCHPLSRQYSSVQKITVNHVEMDQTAAAGCRFFTTLLLLLCSEGGNYQHTLYRKIRLRE